MRRWQNGKVKQKLANSQRKHRFHDEEHLQTGRGVYIYMYMCVCIMCVNNVNEDKVCDVNEDKVCVSHDIGTN